MLNSITLFFILFTLWIFSSIFMGLNLTFIISGLFISSITAFVCWRLGLITSKTDFMFLHAGFYKFIFGKINQNLFNVFRLSFQFLNPSHKFKPIVDYVFLNKDKDSEAVLYTNLFTFLSGTLCVAIKKRYIIIHSLGDCYFNVSEIYNISNAVGKVYDDSLV